MMITGDSQGEEEEADEEGEDEDGRSYLQRKCSSLAPMQPLASRTCCSEGWAVLTKYVKLDSYATLFTCLVQCIQYYSKVGLYRPQYMSAILSEQSSYSSSASSSSLPLKLRSHDGAAAAVQGHRLICRRRC